MVHAINQHGRETYFSDRVWALMPKHKNGWIEFSEQGEVVVPQQIIEFQQSLKKEGVVVEENDNKPVAETVTEQPKEEPQPTIKAETVTEQSTEPIKETPTVNEPVEAEKKSPVKPRSAKTRTVAKNKSKKAKK